jgi:hypothetical protein
MYKKVLEFFLNLTWKIYRIATFYNHQKYGRLSDLKWAQNHPNANKTKPTCWKDFLQ